MRHPILLRLRDHHLSGRGRVGSTTTVSLFAFIFAARVDSVPKPTGQDTIIPLVGESGFRNLGCSGIVNAETRMIDGCYRDGSGTDGVSANPATLTGASPLHDVLCDFVNVILGLRFLLLRLLGDEQWLLGVH